MAGRKSRLKRTGLSKDQRRAISRLAGGGDEFRERARYEHRGILLHMHSDRANMYFCMAQERYVKIIENGKLPELAPVEAVIFCALAMLVFTLGNPVTSEEVFHALNMVREEGPFNLLAGFPCDYDELWKFKGEVTPHTFLNEVLPKTFAVLQAQGYLAEGSLQTWNEKEAQEGLREQ